MPCQTPRIICHSGISMNSWSRRSCSAAEGSDRTFEVSRFPRSISRLSINGRIWPFAASQLLAVMFSGDIEHEVLHVAFKLGQFFGKRCELGRCRDEFPTMPLKSADAK
jgi:hypothetical protein